MRKKFAKNCLLIILILLVGLFSSQLSADAKTVYVDTDNDHTEQDGSSPAKAFTTIQQGFSLLQPGDELVVAPGVYYERPELQVSATSADRPIWIRANPVGSVTISGMWEDGAKGLVQWNETSWDGVYVAQHGPALFGASDDTFLFRFNNVEDLVAHTLEFNSLDREQTITLQKPDYGFVADGDHIYLRLPDGADPNGRSVLLSDGADDEMEWYNLMTVHETPYVIIDGFRFLGSGTHCLWIDYDSPSVTVRNTIFEYCHLGARLPDRSLVEWSEYVYPGFRAFAEQVMRDNPAHWKDGVYHLVKDYQAAAHDGTAVFEGCLADTFWRHEPSIECEFRNNFVHETFDGECFGEFSNSESHHNVYEYNYDNHVEMESWVRQFHSENLRLHHSLFLACPMGPISHQGSHNLHGPQYVYRNVIFGYTDYGRDSWTQIKSDADRAESGIHYVNNVIWGGESSLFWNSRSNLHFRNNLFVFEEVTDLENPNEPLDSDHNGLVNLVDRPWLRGGHGLYLGSEPNLSGLNNPEELDFTLTENSSLIDQGELFSGITDNIEDGRPDIGAFEYGDEPGLEWPRPRITTFSCDPPERWNGHVPEDYCNNITDDVGEDTASSDAEVDVRDSDDVGVEDIGNNVSGDDGCQACRYTTTVSFSWRSLFLFTIFAGLGILRRRKRSLQ